MDLRIRTLSINKSLSAIEDLVLPRVCVVCGRPLIPQEKHICSACIADMPLTNFSRSAHNDMADKFNARIKDKRYCYACALYYYNDESGYRNISKALKYGRNFKAGRYFGKMLGEEIAASELFGDVDLIIPVPLHWTRRWKRGYNQAEIIASEVARTTGAAFETDILERIRRTKTQTRQSREEKERNVKDAFKARGGIEVKRSHILIIDDIFTTGSTLAECHKAIRSITGEETRISVASLGYVGR